MGPVDLAVNSFGQGMNVTMTQMVAAFSSLINGGNLYQPTVVKRIETQTGEIVENKTSVVLRQTITARTSELLRRYLYNTVDSGTAKTAGVEGYAIGGKTGTAEKYPRGNEKYVVSFIGFAPIDNPKYVIYVVIDEPNVEKQSDSTQATVLAQKIMADIMPYMNIYQTNNEQTGEVTDPEQYEPGGFIEGENVTDPIAEQAGTHIETETESQTQQVPTQEPETSQENVTESIQETVVEPQIDQTETTIQGLEPLTQPPTQVDG